MKDGTDKFRKALVEALFSTRKARGYSHEAIAKKAGISRQTLGKIESYQTNPTMLTMYKIVTAMDMSMEEFVKEMSRYLDGQR